MYSKVVVLEMLNFALCSKKLQFCVKSQEKIKKILWTQKIASLMPSYKQLTREVMHFKDKEYINDLDHFLTKKIHAHMMHITSFI